LGVRVPTLAVSPWIRRNTLINKPNSSQKRNEFSEFETASIPATIIDIFGLQGTLTKRTEFAAVFGDLISAKLRTDCIETLPTLPYPPLGEMER